MSFYKTFLMIRAVTNNHRNVELSEIQTSGRKAYRRPDKNNEKNKLKFSEDGGEIQGHTQGREYSWDGQQKRRQQTKGRW